jgi:dihydrofolate reductase / thymidylate synthase
VLEIIVMALAQFSIIVAVDAGDGIAKDKEIPWHSTEDMRFFRDTTRGKGKNAVIMGRITYESIPEAHRPLEGRTCVVISRTWKQEGHSDVLVFDSVVDALAGLGGSTKSYDDIFIAGGEGIYKECVDKFMYLCKRIYVTKFKMDYTCDQHFPFSAIKDLPLATDPTKSRDYTRFIYAPKIEHAEYQYLNILTQVKETGEQKTDRTGTGTMSIFGARMEFDLTKNIPIITTKKVNYDSIIKELLFFISGKTDTRLLSEQNVKIWQANTKKEVWEKLGQKWEEGDMGPNYGFQWRHWGAEYTGCDTDYTGKGIDQLTELIENIRTDPHSRRHILSAWNVSQIKQTNPFPCHILAQFNVSNDRKWIDCQLYQRSGDLFLGVPFNITSYALLTYMIAHICNMQPRKLIHIIGDAHIYLNHGEQVKKQLNRTPRPFPTLKFRNATRIHEIGDFTVDSFLIESYSSWPYIAAEMSA